jgi:hypothetical protein
MLSTSSPRQLNKQTITMDSSYTGILGKIDTMKLVIAGYIEIDGVDEYIVKVYKVNNTRSKFTILHGCRYSFIHDLDITLKINKKYKNRDCVVVYNYKFSELDIKNNVVIKISDGSAHPKVIVNGNKAYSYNFVDIKYTSKKSYWRNIAKSVFGAKLDIENLTP